MKTRFGQHWRGQELSNVQMDHMAPGRMGRLKKRESTLAHVKEGLKDLGAELGAPRENRDNTRKLETVEEETITGRWNSAVSYYGGPGAEKPSACSNDPELRKEGT